MKKTIRLFAILSFVVLLFSFAKKEPQSTDYVKGEILIQFKPGIKDQYHAAQTLSEEFTNISLTAEEPLSEVMKIWLCRYDHYKISDTEVLESIKSHPVINLVQFNHYIELRDSIPNDPFFEEQWNFLNTGQNGGTPGADVNATEAWGSNTGGVTINGDTVIVAVVDGGCDLDHPDLQLWKNYHEIPLNGIDDDTNGYVDDYHGWNAYSNTPSIFDDDHGTHVTGIVAAKTNNAEGVAGLNWHGKVLPVAGSSTVEATVVRAYSYVLTMRRLYNETNGAKGAFIVATNSSFGVNQGQPQNYPIWEAMYDSMGMEGILSAGATANANWDIDELGDVPTAFETDYMISVTNTTKNDNKASNAAYGDTTIDIGAPGSLVFSTKNNGNYGLKSGTSMSCPHIAGATAYLISAADQDFLDNYMTDPANYILKIKQYLLDGVDILPTLENVTVSGGRLNLQTSVSIMQDPPLMLLSHDSIIMTIEQTMSDSAEVLITNIGGSLLNYEIGVQGQLSWIILNKDQGSIEKEDTDSVMVTLSAENLSQGVYTSKLFFKYNYFNYDTIPVKLTVTPYTGIISEQFTDSEVKISPVPFNETLFIDFKLENEEKIEFSLLNMNGELIFKKQFSAEKKRVSVKLPELPHGTYLCKIETDHKQLTRKLIH